MKPIQLLAILALAILMPHTMRCEISRQYHTTGTIADTIITTGNDFADITYYAAVEIRASLPNTKQQQNPWKEHFGIRYHETALGYTQATLTPANTDYLNLNDRTGMLLTIVRHNNIQNTDSLIHSSLLTDHMAYGREENSMAIEIYNTGNIKIFAGKRELALAYEYHESNAIHGERSIVINGIADVTLIVDESEPDPASVLNTTWTLSRLNDYFANQRTALKPLEGYWQYFDQDTNDRYCRLGGRYRIAIIDDGAGGYNILYVSGAKIYPDKWISGMRKGHMQPTVFNNNYDLEWIDAEMKPILSESYAVMEQNSLLTFNFPLLKSVIRMYRVPMDI